MGLMKTDKNGRQYQVIDSIVFQKEDTNGSKYFASKLFIDLNATNFLVLEQVSKKRWIARQYKRKDSNKNQGYSNDSVRQNQSDNI